MKIKIKNSLVVICLAFLSTKLVAFPEAVKLLGVFSGSSTSSMAVLFDEKGKMHYVKIGQKLPQDPRYVLQKVERKKVIFRSKGQEVVLYPSKKNYPKAANQTTAQTNPKTSGAIIEENYAFEQTMMDKIFSGTTVKYDPDLHGEGLDAELKRNKAKDKKRIELSAGTAFVEDRRNSEN